VNDSKDPDDLVTLVSKPTEFEAHALVVVLEEAGINAFAFGMPQSLAPLGGPVTAVPVQVRRADLERAQRAMEKNIADSVDLDWDSVDVGERTDRLPLTTRRGMPWPARIGFAVAAAALIIMLLAALGTFGSLVWP
jgi:hypothetical protein